MEGDAIALADTRGDEACSEVDHSVPELLRGHRYELVATAIHESRVVRLVVSSHHQLLNSVDTRWYRDSSWRGVGLHQALLGYTPIVETRADSRRTGIHRSMRELPALGYDAGFPIRYQESTWDNLRISQGSTLHSTRR